VSIQYTEFSFTDLGDLRIGLTSDGKIKLKDLLIKYADWNDDEVFLELIDEQLMAGWTIIAPEQVRATRALLILANDVHYDADGNLSHVECAYWHPSNLLGTVCKTLLEQGYVIFEKGR